MIKRLRSRVRINAKGRNLYKFINSLHSERIDCFGQYCRNDVFYADIYSRDLSKIQNLAEELEIELKTFTYETVSKKLSCYKKRFGLIIGAAAVLTGTLYFSQVIVSIEIEGNTTIPNDTILSALAELDIKRGAVIRNLDLRYCEYELRLMVDGVLWAGMHRTGNRLVVQIEEFDKKPEMLLDRVPCNIVSGKNAEITSVSVYDGMLMHKVGDYVTENTLLISGVAKDDTGHATIHHANGVITGIYSETVNFSEEYAAKRYMPTGKKRKQRYLELFSLDIPLFSGKNKYSLFDVKTVRKPIKAFGKELPIALKTDDISEVRLSEASCNEDELDKLLMQKIYLYEKNFLNDKKIIERNIEKIKSDSKLTYSVVYKLEGNICRQSNIFIK